MCSHDYATIVIMFSRFCFNKVPGKTFRIAYGDSCVDPAEDRKLLHRAISFDNSQKRTFDLILFALDWYTNFSGFPNLVEVLELQKYSRVTDYYRLFCFRQILFSMCCLLILMYLWLVCKDMNHRELGIQ